MNKKAFTLIELLVVIAIVGIISGIVFVQLNGATNAAQDSKKKTNLNTIGKALVINDVESGRYPIEPTTCTIGIDCENFDAEMDEYLPDVFTESYSYQSTDGTDCTLSVVLSTGYLYQYSCLNKTYSINQSVNGVCGTKNGKYAASAPTGTEACSTGTISGMTGSYSWICSGINGGDSSGTCATVAAAYTVVSFTTVGTNYWTVPDGVTSVDYLIVGGGGNGGWGSNDGSGGGGAGGYYTGSGLAVSGTETIIVGGATLSSSLTNDGATIVAPAGVSGSGISAGASGNGYSGGSYTFYAGGGGGGVTAAGGAATASRGGDGGAGTTVTIGGTVISFGGGGGGGSYDYQAGSGGFGGGGAGSYIGDGIAATPNTGGGGGGSNGGTSTQGGAGGSGIVVIGYISNN